MSDLDWMVDVPAWLRPPTDDLFVWKDQRTVTVWLLPDGGGESSRADPVTPASAVTTADGVAAWAEQIRLVAEAIFAETDALPPLLVVIELIDAVYRRIPIGEVTHRIKVLFHDSVLSHDGVSSSDGGGNVDVEALHGVLSAIASWGQRSVGTATEHLVHVCRYVLGSLDRSGWVADRDADQAMECLRVDGPDLSPDWCRRAVAPKDGPIRRQRCQNALDAYRQISRLPVDVGAFETFVATGVRRVPSPVQNLATDEPEDASVGLLQRLREHGRYRQLADAAADVAVTLRLPRLRSECESLPIGGVADLVNRGHPDQLLITELAAEPDVLMARMVTGSALYVRRESPPPPSSSRRTLFFETGIRTWGRPRLRVAAAALGVATASTMDRCFAVIDGELKQVDLASTDAVVEMLSRVGVDEHPGDAIAKWHADVSDQPPPVVVVTAATDRDVRFRRSLGCLGGVIVIVVGEDDAVAVIRRGPMGDEILQRLMIGQIEEQSAGQTAGQTDQSASGMEAAVGAASLPRFCTLDRLPLRMPVDLQRSVTRAIDPPKAWVRTPDRQWLLIETGGRGGQLMLDDAPRGRLAGARWVPNQATLIFEHRGALSFWTIDWRTLVVRRLWTRQSPMTFRHVQIEANAIWLIGETIGRLNPVDGDVEAMTEPGGLRWIGDLIFRGMDRRLWTVVAAGSETQFREIGALPGDAGTVVARRLASGLIQTLDIQSGVVMTHSVPPAFESLSQTTRFPSAKLLDVESVEVSADGTSVTFALDGLIDNRKIQLWSAGGGTAGGGTANRGTANRRTGTDTLTPVPGGLDQFDSGLCRQWHRSRSVMSSVRSVGFSEDGLWVLNKSSWWRLNVDDETAIWTRGQSRSAPQSHVRLSHDKSRRLGWTLSRGQWRGVTVWWDSRGWLHLRRSDHDDELSVSLHPNPVAGCLGADRVFGDDYMTGRGWIAVDSTVRQWVTGMLQCL